MYLPLPFRVSRRKIKSLDMPDLPPRSFAVFVTGNYAKVSVRQRFMFLPFLWKETGYSYISSSTLSLKEKYQDALIIATAEAWKKHQENKHWE